MTVELVRAVLLGLLQGLTEYLPVSSSGHLVVVPALLGWPEPSLTFDTAVHAGTAAAVLWYFRREWRDLIVHGVSGLGRLRGEAPSETRTLLLLALASLPAAIVGVVAKDVIEPWFGSPPRAALMLVVTGAVLAGAELLTRGHQRRSAPDGPTALAMGGAQAISILPGLSRSGTTIATGMLAGLGRSSATRFSFLMAGPISAGSFAYQLLDVARSGGTTPEPAAAVALGICAAFLSGLLAIDWLLGFVRRGALYPFAAYCTAFGLFAWWVLH